ncbi:MAG: hypothetical protein K6V97_03715 [Actinomycetia bacterium]|nr:hypothetical protein [Actinomycetes bacterium]
MTWLQFAQALAAAAVVAGGIYLRVFATPAQRAQVAALWQVLQPVADDLVLWMEHFGPTEGAAKFEQAVQQLVQIAKQRGIVLALDEAAQLIQGAYARQKAAGTLQASAPAPKPAPAPPPTP